MLAKTVMNGLRHEATAAMVAATAVMVSNEVILDPYKMRLTLVNFRKWVDKSFDFGDGSVVKVTGESGAGKSTIFEAIYWCLYGRLQKVGTKGSKGRTEVQLEMDVEPGTTYVVHRWGQKSVSLSKGSESWDGDEAQSRIDAYFGSHDLFLMSSYMRAEIIHPLLSASPAEKRELTGLIFPDASKYDKYRAKLLEIRRKDEAEMVTVTSESKRLEASIHTIENLEDFNMEAMEPVGDPKTLRERLKVTSKDLEEARRVITIHGSLKDQIQSLDSRNMVPPDLGELEAMKRRLSSSKTVNIRLDLLQDRIQEIRNDLEVKRKDEHESKAKIYDQLLALAPSISSMDSDIQKVSTECEKASYLLMQYEQSLMALEHNARIEDVLECPNCRAHLLHLEEGLIICPEKDLTLKEVPHKVSQRDVQTLRIKVTRLGEHKNELLDRYNRYKRILTDNGIPESADIGSLKSLTLEIQRLRAEEIGLESKIKNAMADTREYIPLEDRKILESRIREMEIQDMEVKSITRQRSDLEARIQGIQSSHSWMSSSDDHLHNLEKAVHDLQSCISRAESALRIKNLRIKYDAFKAAMETMMQRRSILEKRLIAMSKAEVLLTTAYQDYVGLKLKDIEYEVSMLAKLFFDQSMNILLIPGRDSVSGNPRPSFDLDIEYGGIHYDDIRLMSTGERKRLSLILMMVISSYSGGKMFLLDEALNSIGSDTRGIIMNEIGRMNLSTLITSHDDIPGGYAHELTL